MEKSELTYKMYSMVLYQLNDKQKGIQAGHANTVYGQKFKNDAAYNKWADHDLTHIILDGGTSTSLTKYFEELKQVGIDVVPFFEPDLYNVMTSFSFLADERAWDRVKYPDQANDLTKAFFAPIIPEYAERVKQEQLELYGTEQNIFLREFLPKLRLA